MKRDARIYPKFETAESRKMKKNKRDANKDDARAILKLNHHPPNFASLSAA